MITEKKQDKCLITRVDITTGIKSTDLLNEIKEHYEKLLKKGILSDYTTRLYVQELRSEKTFYIIKSTRGNKK